MNTEKRQEVERKVVHHLVREMKAAGWEAYRVFDGEEFEKTATETEVMDTVFSVDEAVIWFRKGDLKRVASIVLGNDGYDAIADSSCSRADIPGDDFEAVMEKVYAYAETLA